MLVKTLQGEYGRINTKVKGGLLIPVTMLNENLQVRYWKNKPVIKFMKPYELIYRPEVIVKV